MGHGNKQFRNKAASKKETSRGLAIALATAGGVVVGSAGTYFLAKPPVAPKASTPPAVVGTPQGQAIAMPSQPQFTPAPQPPGEVPPGKVWSVEHGHWHDAPNALTVTPPAAPTPAPASTPTPAPATATPATATTTPPPAAAPTEKKD